MDAELALLTSTVRTDADRVRALLAPDFAEIGASGRRWSLDETVAERSHERGRMESETSEWLFNELAAGIVLVNYRVVTQGRESRRSSVWQVSGDGSVLRFHQGTNRLWVVENTPVSITPVHQYLSQKLHMLVATRQLQVVGKRRRRITIKP